MTWNKYGRAIVALVALTVFPTQVFGQPIICTWRAPDPPCEGEKCVIEDMDIVVVTVEPTGQMSMNDGHAIVTRDELKKYASAWAKTGTWPIIVRGAPGAKEEELTSIVALFRKVGVRTSVSCETSRP
jgi:biopolymer transport protein ExbD